MQPLGELPRRAAADRAFRGRGRHPGHGEFLPGPARRGRAAAAGDRLSMAHDDTPASVDFTLDPADNARLANLCGQFDEHLRQLEQRLGIEINNNGNRFRVIGAPEAARAAAEVLKALYAATATERISRESVHLSLQQSDLVARIGDAPEGGDTEVA